MKTLFLITITVFVVFCFFSPSTSGLQKLSRSLHNVLQPQRFTATVKHTVKSISFKVGKTLSPSQAHLCDRAATILTNRSVVLFFLGSTTLLLFACLNGTSAFSFLSTLEHELMHGIAALFCGGKFNSITVTACKGGHAEVTSNAFVRLAPYCFPLFCLMLCCILPFLNDQAKIAGILVTGMAYGNFIRGNFHHIGIQTDIHKSGGKLLAYPVIFSANAVLVSGLLIFITRM